MSSEPKHKFTVKVGDALRTVQAHTYDEFADELRNAHDSLQACYDLLQAAKAVGNVASTPAPAAAPAAAPAQAPAAFSDAVAQAPIGPDGQPMVPKVGTSARGPWKGGFDARGKGDSDAIFLNRGTPEWNNFPVPA